MVHNLTHVVQLLALDTGDGELHETVCRLCGHHLRVLGLVAYVASAEEAERFNLADGTGSYGPLRTQAVGGVSAELDYVCSNCLQQGATGSIVGEGQYLVWPLAAQWRTARARAKRLSSWLPSARRRFVRAASEAA